MENLYRGLSRTKHVSYEMFRIHSWDQYVPLVTIKTPLLFHAKGREVQPPKYFFFFWEQNENTFGVVICHLPQKFQMHLPEENKMQVILGKIIKILVVRRHAFYTGISMRNIVNVIVVLMNSRTHFSRGDLYMSRNDKELQM